MKTAKILLLSPPPSCFTQRPASPQALKYYNQTNGLLPSSCTLLVQLPLISPMFQSQQLLPGPSFIQICVSISLNVYESWGHHAAFHKDSLVLCSTSTPFAKILRFGLVQNFLETFRWAEVHLNVCILCAC